MNIEEHGRFDGYTGTRMYRVDHPNHGAADIAAPSPTAAVIVAAKLWDENWQDQVFFSDCKCSHLAYSGRWAVG